MSTTVKALRFYGLLNADEWRPDVIVTHILLLFISCTHLMSSPELNEQSHLPTAWANTCHNTTHLGRGGTGSDRVGQRILTKSRKNKHLESHFSNWTSLCEVKSMFKSCYITKNTAIINIKNINSKDYICIYTHKYIWTHIRTQNLYMRSVQLGRWRPKEGKFGSWSSQSFITWMCSGPPAAPGWI